MTDIRSYRLVGLLAAFWAAGLLLRAAPGDVEGGFNPAPNGIVYAAAIQADAKIVLGGAFTTVAGAARGALARLNADGSIDASFNPTVAGEVYGVLIQSDGAIVVAGQFSSVNGTGRGNLARLNADGTLDASFVPSANAPVHALALQADGKIVLGGMFTTLSGAGRSNLARLNGDGSLDFSFNPGASGPVLALALQADGRILAGGSFPFIAGAVRANVARLNADGSADMGFNPGAGGPVLVLQAQADGRILVGGQFTSVAGAARNHLARVEADGSLDAGFDPNCDGDITTLAIQTDGRLLLGGAFATVGGSGRDRLARLNADGSADSAFNPGVDGPVHALALSADGRVVAAGAFATVGGIARANVARLDNDPASQSLAVAGAARLEWLRGGASPEVAALSFESSRNSGVSWSVLGAGTRISGGWELTGLNLVGNGLVRARARVVSGRYGASSGLVEASTSFAYPEPEIAVRGQGMVIVDGDVTPSYADSTDFGAALSGSGTVVRTFTIENTGAAVLHLTGSPRVQVTGANAADFTVVQPPTSVYGDAVSFQVKFTPAATGLRTATLSIVSDDVDEATYDFAVQGTGVVLGGIDPALDGNFNGRVNCTAVQPDGKLLVAGNFTTAGGIGHNRIVRFNVDGSLDAGFVGTVGSANIALTNHIRTMTVQANGEIIIGGHFPNASGAGHTRLARLAPDGAADPLFTSAANAAVYGVLVQPDGKLLVGGAFTQLNGTVRSHLGRLNADGTLDAGFNPVVDGDVTTMALQPDGKIVIGGAFVTVGGVTRNHLARVNSDGTPDAGFDPNTDTYVTAVAIQPDGNIVVGGNFNTVGGVARAKIARVDSTGVLDASFNPGANGNVNCLVLQADGAIIASGEFTSLGGTARNRCGRLNADGSLDGGFNPNANNAVYSAELLPDGSVVLGGDFTTMGGATRNRLARIVNSTATQSLTAPDAGRIEWLLGGTAPVLAQPGFELSTDGGGTWSSLGAPAAISGGWALTGLSLPGTGMIRARARIMGAEGANSAGLLQTTTIFPSGPHVSLEQPLNNAVQADGRTYFGVLSIGASSTRTFFIRNSGNADLTGLAVAIDGPDAAAFSLVSAPATTVTGFGGIASFTVQFTAPGNGARTATLHLTSNDAVNNPFDVTLLGTGPGPEITVSGHGVAIAAGDSTPAIADHTDFGNALVTGGIIVRTFTIANAGPLPLALTGSPRVQIFGANAADFTVTAPPDATVAVSGSTAFQITFDPSATGVRTAVVSIANDDADENPFTFSIQGTGAMPGDFDTSFNPMVSRFASSLCEQPDGKFIIAGAFGLVGGVSRPHLARIDADGLLDTSFYSAPDGDVLALAIKSDGKMVIGGGFANVNGLARLGVTRLGSDGSVDAGFNPTVTANGTVYSITLLPNGDFIMAGGFPAISGITRIGIGRISGNGNIDAFNPNPSFQYVSGVALQDDQKIVIGGSFVTVGGDVSIGGQNRNALSWLNPDGSVYGSIDPNVNGPVECVAIQADGKAVIGGSFTAVAGVPRNHLARLNADGTLDMGFDPNVSLDVESIVLQADGKIIIGGIFATVSGVSRVYLARLGADGSLDPGFTPLPNREITSVALQSDGRILFSGDFTIAGGMVCSGVGRLMNDPATQSLTVPSTGRIEWLRGGSSPETHDVAFELSTNGGVTWTSLGAGARISGGWELAGQNLPTNGRIRARARIPNGQRAGSSGLVETIVTYSVATPEIAVFEGNGIGGAERQSGVGAFAFAATALGASSTTQTFTVQNTGGATLSGLGLSSTGGNSSDFIPGSLGAASLAPGATTTCTVTFSPSASGVRTAAIQIASNDADENPFVINVSGTGLASLDNWRLVHFGTATNSGSAADNADPDGDGLANLIEYALALDPLVASTTSLPTVSTGGGNWIYTYVRPAATTELTYEVEISTDLASWSAGGVTHSLVSSSGGNETWQAVYPLGSATNVFFRLKVTAP